MNLSMQNHVSGILKSHTASQFPQGGAYVDGIWQDNAGTPVTGIDVNVQPATMREIQTLQLGGRRIQDTRRVYINTDVTLSLKNADIWEFDNELAGIQFECISVDDRPTRSYRKIFVSVITP